MESRPGIEVDMTLSIGSGGDLRATVAGMDRRPYFESHHKLRPSREDEAKI